MSREGFDLGEEGRSVGLNVGVAKKGNMGIEEEFHCEGLKP